MDIKNKVILYKDQDGDIDLKVVFQDETVWLTQAQMAVLFKKGVTLISKHINQIYKEKELEREKTSYKQANSIKSGIGLNKRVTYYNLDVVISVGYRVKSKQGTQFRMWATSHLKEYLLRGYILNEARIRENSELKLKDLENTVQFLRGIVEQKRLAGYEIELFNIISDYTQTWITLNRYDLGTLKIEKVKKKALARLEYSEVIQSIVRFKSRLIKSGEASELFGREVGGKFKAALGAVHQTFDGIDVYPSVEEKAAHLLYFIIKDHPFADGNKRIGSLIFLLYLIENRALYNKRGDRKIESAALTTLALLVAESRPEQKDTMVKLIVNLINN